MPETRHGNLATPRDKNSLDKILVCITACLVSGPGVGVINVSF